MRGVALLVSLVLLGSLVVKHFSKTEASLSSSEGLSSVNSSSVFLGTYPIRPIPKPLPKPFPGPKPLGPLPLIRS
ncbi:MAG: hypothetical protein ACP5QP_03755 [Brevinematia bacterium]